MDNSAKGSEGSLFGSLFSKFIADFNSFFSIVLAYLVIFKNYLVLKRIVGVALLDEDQFIESLLKSALNYGKRYLSRTISEILKEWSMDQLLEEDQFLKN